jgi:hypothetical protein
VKAQWDHAVNDLHIKFEPSAEDPYDSYNAVKDDVLKNRRMKIFTGGNPLPPDHPLAAVDPDTGLTYTTMLRGVHDLFGHVAGDNDFSEQGEGGATYAHRQMMSPKSVPALLNETEGQVSQYFHGKGKGDFPEQKVIIKSKNNNNKLANLIEIEIRNSSEGHYAQMLCVCNRDNLFNLLNNNIEKTKITNNNLVLKGESITILDEIINNN